MCASHPVSLIQSRTHVRARTHTHAHTRTQASCHSCCNPAIGSLASLRCACARLREHAASAPRALAGWRRLQAASAAACVRCWRHRRTAHRCTAAMRLAGTACLRNACLTVDGLANRIRQHGLDKAVEGDLVLVDSSADEREPAADEGLCPLAFACLCVSVPVTLPVSVCLWCCRITHKPRPGAEPDAWLQQPQCRR